MKTKYPNSLNPRTMRRSAWAVGIVGMALCLVYFFREEHVDLFYTLGWFLLYSAIIFGYYFLQYVEIDDEAGTIVYSPTKKYPILIADLAYATVYTNRKGKPVRLFLHDRDVHFMDIRTKASNIEAILRQILSINPSIEVKRTRQ